MPSYTIYANTDDREGTGSSASWASARELTPGTAASASAANTFPSARLVGDYFIRQHFLHFDTTSVAGTLTAASFNFNCYLISGSGDSIEAMERTWTTPDLVPGSSLVKDYNAVSVTATGYKTFSKVTLSLASSSTYGVVVYAERQRTDVAPSGGDYAGFDTADASGTSNDPYLSVTTSTGFTLACNVGSYTATGQTVGLLAGRRVAADGGTYSLTGQTVSLLATRTLALDAGSYILTGQDAGLRAGRLLAIGGGTFTLTGQDATLLVGRTISAEPGAYTLTGTDMDFVYWPHVQPGSVSWSDIAPTAGAWTPITPTTVTWS